MSLQRTSFYLKPRNTAWFLSYILIFLVIAQIAGLIMHYILGHGSVFGLIRLFDFNTEQNIPTLFNTILFILSATLFFLIWKAGGTGKKARWIWLFMSFVLLFLALDEFCEIHENLSAPFHERFDTSGLLYYAWVIPYGIAAILVLLFFVPVWWKMGKRIRLLFAISVIMYFTGAVAFEMFGGREFEQLGDQLDLKCCLLATVEETLEMGGMILLIYTLMKLINEEFDDLSIRIG